MMYTCWQLYERSATGLSADITGFYQGREVQGLGGDVSPLVVVLCCLAAAS